MVEEIKCFWFVTWSQKTWLYRWKALVVTHHLLKFNDQRSCGIVEVKYLICHMTLQDNVIKRFRIYWRNLFIVQNHLAKFWSHSHFGSGDITYVICYMTLQDHLIKGSFEIYGQKFLIECNNLARFGGHGHCGSGDIFKSITWLHVTACSKFCVNFWVEAYHSKSPPYHVWSPQVLLQWRYNRIFHVTLQYHIIKGLCEFTKGRPLLFIPILPSLVATGIVLVDI